MSFTVVQGSDVLDSGVRERCSGVLVSGVREWCSGVLVSGGRQWWSSQWCEAVVF